MPTTETAPETKQVWMVERTFSADSPHILVIRYATPDGERYLQKERAYNRFGGNAPEVTAAINATAEDLVSVSDSETRERYAAEAERMMERHDPDDAV
jgi:acetylornithine/succinyldiaminopimelate/putrescine aminotransferase